MIEHEEGHTPICLTSPGFIKCDTCTAQREITEEWLKILERNRHLLEYISKLKAQGRMPCLAKTLSRDMAKIRFPNLIYPVGDPVYIHIYPREDFVLMYHPIEPRLPPEERVIVNKVESYIMKMIDEKYVPRNIKEKEEILNKLLEDAIRRLRIDRNLYDMLKYELYCNLIGMGILEPFIRDPYLEDISISGIGPIFVHHKIFGLLESTVGFKSYDEVDKFIIRLSERIGKPVSIRRAIVDATLPDGSRVNIVYGKDISLRGSNLTIRKFPSKPMSIIELIKLGTLNSTIAAYLWMALENGLSIFFVGSTASGKTTNLNASTTFINPNWKIVSIEEVAEVVLPHPNWIREVVRGSAVAETSRMGVVDMYELLKAALRQRPNYIIVGEIRGREAYIAFQAMQTGHPILSTFHASNMGALIHRLTGPPMNVSKTNLDNLNLVVFQGLVQDEETGKMKRRVFSINEILGYNPTEDSIDFVEVISWNPLTDEFIFRGLGSSYILENIIARRMGIPRSDLMRVYKELELRASILDYMVELNITDFYKVWNIIRVIYNIGTKRAFEYLDSIASRGGNYAL